MSRIGKVPIEIPAGVSIAVDGSVVTVKGKKEELECILPEQISVEQQGTQFIVSRDNDSTAARSNQGLGRTLVANLVDGVVAGFQKKLIIEGVGYRAEVKGDRWVIFTLGYSHPIFFRIPEGVTVSVEPKQNAVTVSGANKQLVGATAAEIRQLRPPEPYKGKGVRYADEVIRRKEGKAGGK